MSNIRSLCGTFTAKYRRFLLGLLSLGLVVPTAPAGTLTGTLTGDTGAPVVGAGIEILTSDGQPATPGLVLTDVDGHYVVNIPEAPYDLRIHGPAGSIWANRAVDNVVIVGSLFRHRSMLSTAVTVSGVVTDAAGLPAARVVPQFRDSITGEAWLTLGLPSDATGRFSARVPKGTWDMRFLPPSDMTALGAATVAGLTISADLSRDAQLPATVPVDVRVLDAAGAPIVGAMVEATDVRAPAFGPARSETTDASGRATLALPLGDHDVSVRPPQNAPSVPAIMRDVKVTGPATLTDIRLQAGVLVNGRVRDAGSGKAIARAELRFEQPGQEPISIGRTNSSGFFTAIVPPGTWTIDVHPAMGSRVARHFIDGFVASGATAPFIDAPPAWLLEGTATSASGAGMPGTALFIVNADSGLVVPINSAATDRFGAFEVSLPLGNYNLDLVPPIDSGLAGRRVRQDIQGGDLRMMPTALPAGFLATGRIVDGMGRAVPGFVLLATNVSTGEVQPLGGNVTDAFGEFATRLPPGTWHVEAIAPAPYLGTALDVTIAGDADLGDLLVGKGSAVDGMVVDASGVPLRNVTVSFVDPTTGLPIAQPVVTDGSGRFARGVVDGPAQVRLDPAPGSPLQSASRSFMVSGATALGSIMLGTLDLDGDGFGDLVDLCPTFADPLQLDRDVDGRGDACDNCRIRPNASQADSDLDGIGDPCEFIWGDIAPVAAPDGRVDVGDVVTALRMSVGLEPINAEQAIRANVAPADMTPASPAPFATPNLSAPGVIDVGDVVLLLRSCVGVVMFPQPR